MSFTLTFAERLRHAVNQDCHSVYIQIYDIIKLFLSFHFDVRDELMLWKRTIGVLARIIVYVCEQCSRRKCYDMLEFLFALELH